MGLTQLQEQALTKLRTSGASDLGVGLDDSRLLYLLTVIARDFGYQSTIEGLNEDVPELYDRVPSGELAVHGRRFRPLYEAVLRLLPSADTYLFCLGSLLKARLKYERILQAQPIPTIEQVGPRSLLQFGAMDPGPLAAFLFWRKWIYDVDNRAGQETGYLFEPILAQAIGGVPFGARNSPVRRQGRGKGRQVDCVRSVDDQMFAYELKIRVTIAASGQGRWREELEFPTDARLSGYTPVLVVLDETPNPKLSDLTARFEAEGGRSYVGARAWEHLETEAGPTMSRFLEKYVRVPISAVLEAAPEELPRITFALEDGSLVISIEEDQLVVTRVGESVAGDWIEQDDDDRVIPDDIDEASATT